MLRAVSIPGAELDLHAHAIAYRRTRCFANIAVQVEIKLPSPAGIMLVRQDLAAWLLVCLQVRHGCAAGPGAACANPADCVRAGGADEDERVDARIFMTEVKVMLVMGISKLPPL